jgi:hypothetical protein
MEIDHIRALIKVAELERQLAEARKAWEATRDCILNERIDYQAMDQAKAKKLIDAFIEWTNADHEDVLTLSRSQCCYVRDEIERLRKAVEWTPITPENLPKVGDELFDNNCGFVYKAWGEAVTVGYKWLKDHHYLYRRPINPPAPERGSK